jgi:hypothetical protein
MHVNGRMAAYTLADPTGLQNVTPSFHSFSNPSVYCTTNLNRDDLFAGARRTSL